MLEDFKGTESERYYYKGAVLACIDLVQKKNMSIVEAVEKVKSQFAALFMGPKQDEKLQLLEKILYREVTQANSPHPVITSAEVRNRHWWTDYKENSSGHLVYWDRYKDYLTSKPGWSIKSVNDIDTSTDEVMNALANPIAGQEEERRGLVYGDVQSGKTAHYIGLINKAYSAGYKIIIVLSGMQNSLRSQTQSRIDEEVLGYETSTEIKEIQQAMQSTIGVGTITANAANNFLQSLTNRDEKGDFNNTSSSGAYFPPYVIVTKKVKSPLNKIIEFLRRSAIAKTEGRRKYIPKEYPALIIDDEADQASINTKKDAENETTTINGLIRKLLNIFKCKSYVGYTATPFANIFIPHRIDNDEYGKDLFPKDFIALSPRPELYVGAREFFGLGDDYAVPTMPLIRTIEEGEDFLPAGTRSDAPVEELPRELKTAVKYFLISTAVRNLRGQRNKPNTMLVHIVRFVDQQNTLKRKINEFLQEEVCNYIQYGNEDIHAEFKRIYEEDYIQTLAKLKVAFSKYMDGCTLIDFEQVWDEINSIVDEKEIKVWAINGKSDDSLIYKNHKDEPFNVIAIGGDKLSRGLTLEGLTISYFTRSASAMDTLMQMGRWFGYRPGYLDLCRLFTTRELSTKFEIISYSVSNLLTQFEDMNTLKSDPEHFGLRVATDPDILISARNKVRTGEDYQADFSAKLTQTRLLDADDEIIEANYRATDNLLSSIDSCRLDVNGHKTYKKVFGRNKSDGKTFWTGVSGAIVANFFDSYWTSKTATKASSRHIADYIREMNKYGGLTDWTICLAGNNKKGLSSIIATSSVYGPITVNGIQRNTDPEAKDVVDETTRDLHVITSAGDEELDYTQAQIDRAEGLKNRLNNEGKSKQAVSVEVRKAVRDFKHGLLLLYPIGKGAKDIVTKNNKAPYAFAVVFPERNGRGNLKTYKLNEVAMELDSDE